MDLRGGTGSAMGGSICLMGGAGGDVSLCTGDGTGSSSSGAGGAIPPGTDTLVVDLFYPWCNKCMHLQKEVVQLDMVGVKKDTRGAAVRSQQKHFATSCRR